MADGPRGLWRVRVARVRPGRTEAFEVFAQTVSRPMFEAHAGCEAVQVLTLEGEHRAVLTRWRDADAVVALHLSPRYAATVRTLEDAGVVAAASPALLFPVAATSLLSPGVPRSRSSARWRSFSRWQARPPIPARGPR